MSKTSPIGHALLNAMYQIKCEKDREREKGGIGSTAYINGLNKAQQIIIKQLEHELERLEEMERKMRYD